MKIKPSSKSGRVLIELNQRDDQLLAKGANTLVPFRLKKILLPTDFSLCSQKALLYAIPLARQFSATLTLLHVMQPSYGWGDPSQTTPVFPEKSIQRLYEKRLAIMAKRQVGKDVSVVSQIRIGRPASEIIDAASEYQSDLIIIATHGHTGLKHVLLGSVAENVVRHAKCPVLVVREQEREFIES